MKPASELPVPVVYGSPPARGRGLKQNKSNLLHYRRPSPPARGRGLKHKKKKKKKKKKKVAPRAGAWIETVST